MLATEKVFSLLEVSALVLRTAPVDAVLAHLVFAPAQVHSFRTERLAVALLHSEKLVRTGARGDRRRIYHVVDVCLGFWCLLWVLYKRVGN